MASDKGLQTYSLDDSIPDLANRVMRRLNRRLEEDLHKLGMLRRMLGNLETGAGLGKS